MIKIPNVDWTQVQEDGPIHKTDARQDNMREVRNQLGGSGRPPLEANGDMLGALSTQGASTPPSCQCPYGWHALHKDCYAPRVPDFWPAYVVPSWTDAEFAAEYPAEFEYKPMGVGQSMFSPEEIARWQAEALRVYQDGLKEVQAANERLNTREPVNGRYLEGDTEFSDDDIEDFYLGKAT